MSIESVVFVIMEGDRYDDDFDPKQRIVHPSELTKEEFDDICSLTKYSYKKTSYDLQNELRTALRDVNKNTVKKILKEYGYVPAHEAEKIGKVNVNTSEFYQGGLYGTFNPLLMDEYYTEKALKSSEAIFCKVTLSKDHPFMVARALYKKKQEEKKKAVEEKRKQRKLKEAEKLLKEAGKL